MRNRNGSRDRNPAGLTKSLATLAAATLSGLALTLTGCGVGLTGTELGTGSPTAAVTGFHGSVYGGQQPISGATIQLYQVGIAGNGSAATPLIGSTVTTSASGGFNITGLYNCTADSLVYLVATGGNSSGVPGGPSNSAIGLMAALGPCAQLQATAATTFIQMNEVTTVAAVYALSGFMTDYVHVGYTGGNLAGILNAFATSEVLANTTSGTSPGISAGSGVAIPAAAINTLADAAAACVNTSSSTSPGCTALFTAATPGGGSTPANTIAAIANIAHNPALNTSTIYGMVNGQSVFQPTLSTQPGDFTLAISYKGGGGLALPSGIAVDSLGNAWVANEGGNAVTELSNGTYASGTNGFSSPSIVGAQGIAIDGSGNVWLANTGANSVVEMSPNGTITRTVTSGLSGPVGVAIDNIGNVWVTNFDGNSVAEFAPSGTAIGGSPFSNAALQAPTGIAIDANNNVWVGNSSAGNVAKFNNSGVFQATYTDGLLIAPGGVATDTIHNRIWTAGTGINAITALTTTGTAVSGAPYAGGGVAQPLSVAVDGAGTVWTVNNVANGSVSAFTAAGAAKTPAAGLGVLNTPVGLALDGSGNLWATAAGDNSVTEFVGLVAPTITPLVSSTR